MIAAAAKVLGTAAIKDLPAETVKAQVAAWMKYVPADQWPAALPACRVAPYRPGPRTRGSGQPGLKGDLR